MNDAEDSASATATPGLGDRPRNPWVAGILAAFFGTLGQVYVGHFLRSIVWLVVGLVAIAACAALAIYLPNGRAALFIGAVIGLGYWAAIIIDTVWLARRRVPRSRWYQRWWFYLLYWMFLQGANSGLATLIRGQVAEAFYLPARGMESTVLAGERVLVDKLQYRTTPIQRGDVVVFSIDSRRTQFGPQLAPPGRLYCIERVIGVAGDVIEIRDEKVFRNGESIDEPYVAFSPVPGQLDPRLKDTVATVVGEDELFVMGDNRRKSLDSRMYGCIARDDVVGKAAIVFWSREALPEGRASVFPPNREQPAPEPARRIRWERFGQRVE